MNEKRLKIVGKLLNIVEEKRSAYLEGMADYAQLYGTKSEKKFIFDLYNYLSEHGFKNENIKDFVFYC